MITYKRKAGTVDVSVVIRIIDSTDGTPETGVVFNTSGIDLEYRREGAASVDITEATLAALTTAHTDGGFLHIGNGYYRLDLPDAACATGATGVLIHGTVTGMVVIGCYIELVTYDPYDSVRLGLTALPNAAAEAAGGLYTRGTGAGQINQPANGMVDVNAVRHLGTAYATPTVAGVPEVDLTHVNGAAQTATLDTIKTETASIQADTNDLQTQIGTAGSGLTTLVNLIWDELTAEARTAGSYGQLFKDNVNATISSRSSHTAADVWAVATRALTDKVDFALTAADKAAIVNLLWDELTSEARTAGSYGQLLKDNLNAAVSSRAIPGDLMGIVASGITAAKFAADAIGASALATDAVNEIRDAIWAKTFSELAQAIPAATPSAEAAIMALYMALRNAIQITATEKRVTNDAGTVIFKKALSDNGTTYTEAEAVAGP